MFLCGSYPNFHFDSNPVLRIPVDVFFFKFFFKFRLLALADSSIVVKKMFYGFFDGVI